MNQNLTTEKHNVEFKESWRDEYPVAYTALREVILNALLCKCLHKIILCKVSKGFYINNKLNNNNKRHMNISRLYIIQDFTYALVHREYIKTAPIRLLIFDNRIEIVSPGALADGLTIEDIKLGNTFQRNQLIAGFCAKTMMYRGLGSGLLRAYKDGAKLQFINNESGKQFTTIVYRGDSAQLNGKSAQLEGNSAQLNNKFAQLDNDTAQIGALTELQKKILQYLQAHPTASRTDLAIGIKDTTIDKVKHSLTRLQELDILQRVGSKRYGHWEVKIN